MVKVTCLIHAFYEFSFVFRVWNFTLCLINLNVDLFLFIPRASLCTFTLSVICSWITYNFPIEGLSVLSVLAIWAGLCDHFKSMSWQSLVLIISFTMKLCAWETVCLHACICICVYMHMCLCVNVYAHKDICTLPLCALYFLSLKDKLDVCCIRPSNWGILIYCEIFMLIRQGAGLYSMFALAVGGRHSNYSHVLVFCLLSWLWDLLCTPSQMESVSCSLFSVIHCCYTQELRCGGKVCVSGILWCHD